MTNSKPFFTTLPGILSGLAALITAIGGLLFALHETGLLGSTTAPGGGNSVAGETAVSGGAASGNDSSSSAAAGMGVAGGTVSGTASVADTTDGWAIIGKARGGRFFDLDILIDGDSPAIGKRYTVVNDFRLVAKPPQESGGNGQVITLGMVRRGGTVELLDLFVPVPSTETVPVYAKLRARLDSVGD